MRIEPLKEQGMVGPHRIGQVIETRKTGKMSGKNIATCSNPNRECPNFKRAALSTQDPKIFGEYPGDERGIAAEASGEGKKGTVENRIHESMKMGGENEAEMKKGIASIKKGKEETLKGGK